MISWNNAAGDGGGIFSEGSSPVITNCRIGRNEAEGSGGGVFLDGVYVYQGQSPFAVLDSDYIELNEAKWGAGIAMSCSSSKIRNCVVMANENFDTIQDGSGGGIYCNQESYPEIVHCTFWQNQSNEYGGGIDVNNDSEPEIENCILWGNQTDGSGPEMSIRNNSTITISHSDVKWGPTNVFVDGGSLLLWHMESNIVDNPLFDSPPNYCHLTDGSPCIDAGTDAGIFIDIDGETRPQDGFDMGADEYSGQ